MHEFVESGNVEIGQGIVSARDAAAAAQMKVLIVDDHLMFAESLATLLRAEDPQMIVDFRTALDHDTLAKIRSEAYSVLVIDLKMPGIEGVHTIMNRCSISKARIVILSGAARRAEVEAAIAMGIDGFLPKTIGTRALLSAIRLIAAGERFFPVSLLSQNESFEPPDGSLSPRERQVLRYLCTGASNKQIGAQLGLEDSAVKSVVRSLCAKFGVANRTSIVIRALELGFGS